MFIFLNTNNNSQTLLCVIFKPNLAKDWHQIVIWSLICISLIFCKIEMNSLLNKKPIWLVWCKFVHILGNNTIIYTLFLNDQLRSLYQLVQTRNFYKIFPKFNLAPDANTAHYLSTQSKTKARRLKLSVTLFTFKSYTSSSRTEALTSSQDVLERHVAQDCTSPLYSTMHDKSSRSEDLPWSRARFPRSEMFLCCRSYHLHTVY